MGHAIELVRKHLIAVWDADWPAFTQSMADVAELTVTSDCLTHRYDEASGPYRFVSQAWDFYPIDTKLTEEAPGLIRAELNLTNGGRYRKRVKGEYQVDQGKIVSIRLLDRLAHKVAE